MTVRVVEDEELRSVRLEPSFALVHLMLRAAPVHHRAADHVLVEQMALVPDLHRAALAGHKLRHVLG